MTQPLTVAHRGGQLAYPAWAAHTTTVASTRSALLRGLAAGGPGALGLDALPFPVGIQAP